MTIELKLVILIFDVGIGIDCRSFTLTDATIERYDFNINEPGNFDFSVDTSDGFHHNAKGYLDEDKSLVIKGSYSFTSPNEDVYTINYIADKNGFQPFGQRVSQLKTTTTAPLVAEPGVSCTASLCGTGLG